MTLRRSWLVLAACLCAAAGAPAQKVYRCGPDGREYSQLPCKDGSAVDVADPRSEAQQRESQQVTDSQKRIAKQLEAERRQRDAASKAPGAAGIKMQAAEPAPAASKPKGKGGSRSKAPDALAPTPARVPAAP